MNNSDSSINQNNNSPVTLPTLFNLIHRIYVIFNTTLTKCIPISIF